MPSIHVDRRWWVGLPRGPRAVGRGRAVGDGAGRLNRPQLAPTVRDAIRAWILAGAANDCS